MSGAEEAVAAGLADSIEVDGEEIEERAIDTSPEFDDDLGVQRDAEVVHLPVRVDESASTELATVPAYEEIKVLVELAVTLAIADNTPPALRGKPAAVLAVFLTGRELGIPPMTALRTCHVIDGQVTVAPKVRAAMVRRQGLGRIWKHFAAWTDPAGDEHVCPCGRRDTDDENDACTWHGIRADEPHILNSSRYTLAQAQAVKTNKSGGTLAGKDNWQNYGERMLSWRALGYLLDDVFSEVGTGLYSPDELGAVTDEEGQPIFDVTSRDAMTERVKKDREPPKPPDPVAPPDTLAAFERRIEDIKRYKGASEALGELWREKVTHPLKDLLYSECKTVSAVIDVIERRCQKGDFGEPAGTPTGGEKQAPSEEARAGDAPEPSEAREGAGEPASSEPSPEGSGDQEEPTGAPETGESAPPAASPFDPAGLPDTKGTAEDLQWCERATQTPAIAGLIEEVAAEVKEIPADELIPLLKALDISANGLNEQTKRARLAARRVRLRMERMLTP